MAEFGLRQPFNDNLTIVLIGVFCLWTCCIACAGLFVGAKYACKKRKLRISCQMVDPDFKTNHIGMCESDDHDDCIVSSRILTPRQSSLQLKEPSRKSFSQLTNSFGKVQIIVVGDDELNQCVIEAILWDSTKYMLLPMPTCADCIEHLTSVSIVPDLVIIDLDGITEDIHTFCKHIRKVYCPIELPILLTACSSFEDKFVNALESGANDYIIKPIRKQELIQRMTIQLNIKNQHYKQQELSLNEAILHNILPQHAVERIKRGKTYFADEHECVTILFTDICGFTNIAASWPILHVVEMLNDMFSRFDALCIHHDVYKVETIGDSYMCVAGLSMRQNNGRRHATQMTKMAIDMLCIVQSMNSSKNYDKEIAIRIGMHSGPVHSGVVGRIRPRYCLFGDTVNTSSRMESCGFKNVIQMTESTFNLLEEGLKNGVRRLKTRDIKGKGEMCTYVCAPCLDSIPSNLFASDDDLFVSEVCRQKGIHIQLFN